MRTRHELRTHHSARVSFVQTKQKWQRHQCRAGQVQWTLFHINAISSLQYCCLTLRLPLHAGASIQGLTDFRWLTWIILWHGLVSLVIRVCGKKISSCDGSVDFGEWSLVTEVLKLVTKVLKLVTEQLNLVAQKYYPQLQSCHYGTAITNVLPSLTYCHYWCSAIATELWYSLYNGTAFTTVLLWLQCCYDCNADMGTMVLWLQCCHDHSAAMTLATVLKLKTLYQRNRIGSWKIK